MAAFRSGLARLAAAGLVAALGVGSASANGRGGPPPYAPAIWQGLYVGANLGYASFDAEASVAGFGTGVSVQVSDSDAVGGFQIGYNWRKGQYVYGVEANIDVLSEANLGTVRGRFGIAQDNMLIYATAGVGWGDVTALDSSAAFVIGAGVEFDLGRHWRDGFTLGVEALYYAFEEQKFTVFANGTPIATGSVDADAFAVRGRLNYYFK